MSQNEAKRQKDASRRALPHRYRIYGNALSISACAQCITQAAPHVGDPPPALQLDQMLQGPDLSAVSWEKLKGKVVVLEFWDTACGGCVQAIPHLNELADQYRDQPVVFLSISDDNPDRLKRFLQTKPIKTWQAIDGPSGATRDAYGIVGIPTTFLIDPAGKIAAITLPFKLTGKHLDELLAGKPSSLPPPKLYRDPYAGDTQLAVADTNPPPAQISVTLTGPIPFPTNGPYDSRSWNDSHTIFSAKRAYLGDALAEFFGISQKSVILETNLSALYDLTVAGPTNQFPEMQVRLIEILRTQLGLEVQVTNREFDVFVMARASTNAPRIRASTKPGGGGSVAGGFQLGDASMDCIAFFFEGFLEKPVLDDTKVPGKWDVDLKWKMTESELLESSLHRVIRRFMQTNSAAIKSGNLPPEVREKITPHDLALVQRELAKPEADQFAPAPANIIAAAREQLGLEFTPAKRPTKAVVVRAAEMVQPPD